MFITQNTARNPAKVQKVILPFAPTGAVIRAKRALALSEIEASWRPFRASTTASLRARVLISVQRLLPAVD